LRRKGDPQRWRVHHARVVLNEHTNQISSDVDAAIMVVVNRSVQSRTLQALTQERQQVWFERTGRVFPVEQTAAAQMM
jgi:hypothetical protein